MKKIKTIHTSRTMMFAELEKVMAYSSDRDNFIESLSQNVIGKKSSSGIEKTANYLKQLYSFDVEYSPFVAFKYFWKLAEADEKPKLALIYSVNRDELLAESIEVLQKVQLGEKASTESFEAVIERYHPNQYSFNTRKSMSQNIASTWKQAGFIEGKTKNIRIQPEITYLIASFAFLLAYLNGSRGDFILDNVIVRALCVPDSRIRELAVESSMRDLIQYQCAGSVTTFSFTNLKNKIGINGNTN